jgi:hypothetical protein
MEKIASGITTTVTETPTGLVRYIYIFGLLIFLTGSLFISVKHSVLLAQAPSLSESLDSAVSQSGGTFVILSTSMLYLFYSSVVFIALSSFLLLVQLLKPTLLSLKAWAYRIWFYFIWKGTDDFKEELDLRCPQCCSETYRKRRFQGRDINYCKRCRATIDI